MTNAGFFYLTVFSVQLMIFEIPIWITNRSKSMKTACEIVVYLIFETAYYAAIITFLESFNSYYLQVSPLISIYYMHYAFDTYFFIFYPVINTMMHSIFIYHFIRGVS